MLASRRCDNALGLTAPAFPASPTMRSNNPINVAHSRLTDYFARVVEVRCWTQVGHRILPISGSKPHIHPTVAEPIQTMFSERKLL